MNCTPFRSYLDAFLDGEVDPTTQIEFERHVASCAHCQEELHVARTLKRETKLALSNERAPDGLRQRIEASLAAAPIPIGEGRYLGERRPLIRVTTLPARYALPVAAAAIFTMVMGGFYVRKSNSAAAEASVMPIFQDVVRLHSSQLPSDVQNPRQDQVVSYFRGKVEFPVRPADFGPEHAQLLGARLSNVGARRAAALYYEVGGRRMTVVVFAPPTTVTFDESTLGHPIFRSHGRSFFRQRVDGYSVHMMQHEGVTYALTGDMDESRLQHLAEAAHVY
ncbi:MAG: zf-HC2 domain-containing protein [Sandaracinaceae bacterium]|nr:zf-HC2 domain-containing protein [Sandaracinaceae bacterium]